MFFLPLGIVGIVGLALAGWSAFIGRKTEELIPPDGEFRDVPGALMHYRVMGPQDGPVIVMIHGIMSQMRAFSHSLADRLAADHRVVLIDRPGWGYSALKGPRPSLARQGEMIAALIKDLDLERPLLVGHSMGGAVSLALALNHPDAVRGLGLIAPLTQPVDSPPEPLKGLAVPAPLRHLVAWTVAVPMAIRSGAERTKEIFAPDAVPDDFALKAGGALAARPDSFVAGMFEMGIARAEVTQQAQRYSEIAMPVAILYGRGDTLLDPEVHGTKTAQAVSNGSVEIVEGGHMLPITHPDVVEAWIRRVDAQPASAG